MEPDNGLPVAEDCPYWKSGSSDPQSWIDKAIAQIEAYGGVVTRQAFGSESRTARSAFMIEFTKDDEVFKIIWPVLNSMRGETLAERRRQRRCSMT